MDKKIEKQYRERAVLLGNSGNPEVLTELISLLQIQSAQVRRLAISAIGKLAGLVDARTATNAIAPFLQNSHPQVRQYSIKALASYGKYATPFIHDIQDIAENPNEKEYNIRDANIAINHINDAKRIEEELAIHTCSRCSITISPDEYIRSKKAFQRNYCDKCFDEVYMKRRNFDTKVELNKTIRAKDGTLVQSDGERKIAEWLLGNNIAYRYDERFRIIEGMAIRPDFYLPEFDIYIEYWGMDTVDYKIGMLKKQKLYQQEGKKLISLYPEDKNNLNFALGEKINRLNASIQGD